jgi:hypothetical protein
MGKLVGGFVVMLTAGKRQLKLIPTMPSSPCPFSQGEKGSGAGKIH